LHALHEHDTAIDDQYFDIDGRLCSQGLWIRRRLEHAVTQNEPKSNTKNKASIWEAKKRLSGDFTESASEEIAGHDAVLWMVKQYARVTDLSDLQEVAHLLTARSTWKVLQQMESQQFRLSQDTVSYGIAETRIMVDRCTCISNEPNSIHRLPAFNHIVGEVEIMQSIVPGPNHVPDQGRARAKIQDMRSALGAFMRLYPELFATGPEPIGKLMAFFNWKHEAAKRANPARSG
jgi:hypothetical protein